ITYYRENMVINGQGHLRWCYLSGIDVAIDEEGAFQWFENLRRVI
ncbi:42923_t:CDS:1, partial [Gigaspora margarita]